MKSKIKFVMLLGLLGMLLTGCGSIDQSSMESTAQTFVQAVIDGDEEVLNTINKSDEWSWPTNYVLSELGPDFSGRSLDEFTFTVNKERSLVMFESEDEEIKKAARFKPVGEKYYFMDMSSTWSFE
ncbi:hypothetical protein [Alkalihalobacillus sp. R86527]|uniref:hypothetical protein n=1 Tax=Alkalihalobacillus sp. R86527 TaxID=3093863 RepID=UPI00366E794F